MKTPSFSSSSPLLATLPLTSLRAHPFRSPSANLPSAQLASFFEQRGGALGTQNGRREGGGVGGWKGYRLRRNEEGRRREGVGKSSATGDGGGRRRGNSGHTRTSVRALGSKRLESVVLQRVGNPPQPHTQQTQINKQTNKQTNTTLPSFHTVHKRRVGHLIRMQPRRNGSSRGATAERTRGVASHNIFTKQKPV